MCCTEGQRVEKGDILIKLDKTFFEFDVSRQDDLYQNAQVSFEEAELEAKRMETLWNKPDPSVPKKHFESAQFRLREKTHALAGSATELKRAKQNLKEASISAPFSGIISRCYVDSGDSVTTIPPVELVELFDTSRVTLEFSVPQEKWGAVAIGSRVQFQMDGDPKTHVAKVTKVIPVIDTATRSFRCHAEMANPNNQLKAGAFIRGTVEIKEAVAKLACPEKSIFLDPATRATLLWPGRNDEVNLNKLDEELRGSRVQKGDFNGRWSFATASQEG